MNKNSNRILRFLAPMVAGFMLAAPAVQAAPISYFLDQSNALDDGPNYLQVTVAEGANGAIDFTVQILGPLSGMAGSNFGMDSFAFNVIPGGFAEAASISNLPSGWRAANGKRMDGFGFFDIKLQGRGNARLETLTFSVTGIDGDTPEDYAILSTGSTSQGHQFFAAHVGGFELPGCDECGDGYDFEPTSAKGKSGGYSNMANRRIWTRDWQHNRDKIWDHDWYEAECVTSAFFGGTTAVPLPGAAWLFGAGIVGALARARRRRPAA